MNLANKKTIYFAAAFSQSELNQRLCSAIELEVPDVEVFFPIRDAPQKHDKKTFAAIRKAIERASLIVAVLPGLGNDTAWELGYAYGLGKRILAVGEKDHFVVDHNNIMPFGSLSRVLDEDEVTQHIRRMFTESKG